MYSTFKDFFFMAELSYDSYIELDIGFSGVQQKVTVGCKMQNFPYCCLLNVYFFQYFDCL